MVYTPHSDLRLPLYIWICGKSWTVCVCVQVARALLLYVFISVWSRYLFSYSSTGLYCVLVLLMQYTHTQIPWYINHHHRVACSFDDDDGDGLWLALVFCFGSSPRRGVCAGRGVDRGGCRQEKTRRARQLAGTSRKSILLTSNQKLTCSIRKNIRLNGKQMS